MLEWLEQVGVQRRGNEGFLSELKNGKCLDVEDWDERMECFNAATSLAAHKVAS